MCKYGRHDDECKLETSHAHFQDRIIDPPCAAGCYRDGTGNDWHNPRCYKYTPPNLRIVADRVAEELTRLQPYEQNRPIYAPHLVELGKSLLSTGENSEIRLDVFYFAVMMSVIMNLKDAEKGPVSSEYTVSQALQNLEKQFRKLSDNPQPSIAETRKILIHIANFAMIAESKLVTLQNETKNK